MAEAIGMRDGLKITTESGKQFSFSFETFVAERDPLSGIRFVHMRNNVTLTIQYEEGAWRFYLEEDLDEDDVDPIPRVFKKWGMYRPRWVLSVSGSVPAETVKKLGITIFRKSRIDTDGRYVFVGEEKVAEFPEGDTSLTLNNATARVISVDIPPIKYLLIVRVWHRWNYFDERRDIWQEKVAPILHPLKREPK